MKNRRNSDSWILDLEWVSIACFLFSIVLIVIFIFFLLRPSFIQIPTEVSGALARTLQVIVTLVGLILAFSTAVIGLVVHRLGIRLQKLDELEKYTDQAISSVALAGDLTLAQLPEFCDSQQIPDKIYPILHRITKQIFEDPKILSKLDPQNAVRLKLAQAIILSHCPTDAEDNQEAIQFFKASMRSNDLSIVEAALHKMGILLRNLQRFGDSYQVYTRLQTYNRDLSDLGKAITLIATFLTIDKHYNAVSNPPIVGLSPSVIDQINALIYDLDQKIPLSSYPLIIVNAIKILRDLLLRTPLNYSASYYFVKSCDILREFVEREYSSKFSDKKYQRRKPYWLDKEAKYGTDPSYLNKEIIKIFKVKTGTEWFEPLWRFLLTTADYFVKHSEQNIIQEKSSNIEANWAYCASFCAMSLADMDRWYPLYWLADSDSGRIEEYAVKVFSDGEFALKFFNRWGQALSFFKIAQGITEDTEKSTYRFPHLIYSECREKTVFVGEFQVELKNFRDYLFETNSPGCIKDQIIDFSVNHSKEHWDSLYLSGGRLYGNEASFLAGEVAKVLLSISNDQNCRILELGCGTGRNLFFLSDNLNKSRTFECCEYCGVDFSKTAIDIAKSDIRLKLYSTSRVSFEWADNREFLLKESNKWTCKYEMIFANFVLDLYQGEGVQLDTIIRLCEPLLAPDGHLMFTLVAGDDEDFRIIKDWESRPEPDVWKKGILRKDEVYYLVPSGKVRRRWESLSDLEREVVTICSKLNLELVESFEKEEAEFILGMPKLTKLYFVKIKKNKKR